MDITCVPVILAPPDCYMPDFFIQHMYYQITDRSYILTFLADSCQISTLAAWALAIPAEKSIHEKRFGEIENHAIVREVFFT